MALTGSCLAQTQSLATMGKILLVEFWEFEAKLRPSYQSNFQILSGKGTYGAEFAESAYREAIFDFSKLP